MPSTSQLLLVLFWQSGTKIVIIVDKQIALLGGADRNPNNQSIFTDNPSILNIALNYLILDLTLISDRKNLKLDKLISKMMIDQSGKLKDLI